MANVNNILSEIRRSLKNVTDSKTNKLVNEIANAREINMIGHGRSWHVAKMFAQRLTHLGLDVGRLGKKPGRTSKDDLTIVLSGSGETEDVLGIVKKIKKGRIACITMNDDSHIAKHADLVIVINSKTSKQPLRSLFEQSTLIYLDNLITLLMKKLKVKESEMWKRHK